MEENNIKENNFNQESKYIKKMEDEYIYFFTVSLIFGISFAFCIYENLAGLASSLFIISIVLCFKFVLKKLEIKLKSQSYFYIVSSILLSFITVYTDNGMIHFFNYVTIILLFILMMLQQFYDCKNWGFFKYIGSTCYLGISSICCMFYPIEHGINKYKSKGGTSSRLKYVMIGFAVAFPLVLVVLLLLLEADDIFKNLFKEIFIKIFALDAIFTMLFMTVIGFFGFYCFISGLALKNISINEKAKDMEEPIIAITFTSILTFIYIVFCVIQIIFLFSRVSLPMGETYSSYARKGFFELLVVSIINLFIIIICNSYFRKNKILKFILTIMSVCNFIMIASSAYRMILYIKEYNFTFLRILVLWFLILLTLLMIGAVISIYKDKFHLFNYIVFVTVIFYIMFGAIKPDYMIAKYNLTNSQTYSERDILYLMRLSCDAVPAIKDIDESKIEISEYSLSDIYTKYFEKIYFKYEDMDIRTYNFSRGKARSLAKEYLGY